MRGSTSGTDSRARVATSTVATTCDEGILALIPGDPRLVLRAVDDDVGAADPARPLGEQEGRDVRDLLRRSEAASGELAPHPRVEVRRLRVAALSPATALEEDRARAQRVDADAVG